MLNSFCITLCLRISCSTSFLFYLFSFCIIGLFCLYLCVRTFRTLSASCYYAHILCINAIVLLYLSGLNLIVTPCSVSLTIRQIPCRKGYLTHTRNLRDSRVSINSFLPNLQIRWSWEWWNRNKMMPPVSSLPTEQRKWLRQKWKLWSSTRTPWLALWPSKKYKQISGHQGSIS